MKLPVNLPNGPKLPSLLQTLRIIADPTGFLESCAHQFGDPFTLRVLGINSPPVVFFSDPDAIQAIFTSLADRFEFGKVTDVFRPLTGDQSLIMQEGGRHQKQRQLLMPALHGEGLYRCGRLICNITEAVTADWSEGALISVQDWMLDISLEVILQVVFGLQPGERLLRLKMLLHTLLERVNSPLYSVQFFLPPLQQDWGQLSPWGRFVRLRQQIDQLLFAEIMERRVQLNNQLNNQLNDQLQGERTDILSMLLTARDADGEPLSDQELRDQLMTLLLLGHETTASGLTWAFYWLHQNPETLAVLQAELDQLEPQPDPIRLAQQPYLNAVCKEALRVYPIALISQPRRVKQSVSLAGYEFEPGAILVPCIYLAHRRSQAYPQPTRFWPERFLQGSLSQYEYLPFGGGSRSCIGSALAMFEMKLILATLLTRFRFHPAQPIGEIARPARRGITFVPPQQFQLRITKVQAATMVSLA